MHAIQDVLVMDFDPYLPYVTSGARWGAWNCLRTTGTRVSMVQLSLENLNKNPSFSGFQTRPL